MGLTTLTVREQQWVDRAARAIRNEETWEPCEECLQYHPEGYDGKCDSVENQLPAQPQDVKC